MKTRVIAGLLGWARLGSLGAVLAHCATPAQAIPVYDSANHAQNLLIAARTLQQVNQQIRSLQNEAVMLHNMAKHLKRIDFAELDRLQTTLIQIDRLMGRAQAIGYRVAELDANYQALFPTHADEGLSLDRRVAAASARLDAAMAAFHQTMTVQSQVVENVRDDTEALAAIVARSQGAEGSLQAQQATNQLLVLAAKQQFQLQQMMAAQFRSAAIEEARRVTERRQAQAAARRFLGTGRAYTAP